MVSFVLMENDFFSFFFFYEKDKFYKTDLLRVFGYNGEKTLSIV